MNSSWRFSVTVTIALGVFGADASILAQTYGPNPTKGAWWHRGAEPPDGSMDLTGVWFAGTSGVSFGTGDLSEITLAGQEMILTRYGYERYATVDHAKDPNGLCLPPGPARMIMMAHPFMIVQGPGVIAILQESQRVFRIVYTDGRDHPDDVYDYPEWMGSSIGHWENDTLVVDTVSIDERTWLDTSGHEHSDQLRMTERFRLVDQNAIEHVVTYDDPVFFAKPFTTRQIFERQIGDRIMNHSCNENERDIEHLVPTIGGTGLDKAIVEAGPSNE